MKLNSIFLLTAFLASLSLFAQREVIIESTGVDAIKNAVDADLAANDTATVAQTTYILRRNTNYAYMDRYNPTFDLTLVAEEGEGTRPRIVAVPPSEGEAPSFLRAEDGNLTLIGLDLEQKDANGQHTDNSPIRPRGIGARVYIEDCVFDGQRFEIVRTDAEDLRVFFINNIVRNNFQQDLWYKNAGMFFQRANPVDSAVFIHNTYINSTGRAFHEINGAAIDYYEIRNNTFVNVGGMRELGGYGGLGGTAIIDLGRPIELVMTNNLVYNVGYFGAPAAFDSLIGIFNLNPDTLESFTISNNNIYTEPRLLEGTPDTAVQYSLMTFQMDSFMNAQSETMTGEEFLLSMNISEALTFTNESDHYEEYMARKAARWATPATAAQVVLNFPDEESEYDIDYSYNESSASFTGGTNGLPIGSLRWFPDALSSLPVFAVDNQRFAITGSFPNPAVNYTSIRFNLVQPASLEVNIIDLQGRQVFSTGGLRYPAGQDQQLRLNNLDLPTGMYTMVVVANMSDSRVGAVTKLVVQ